MWRDGKNEEGSGEWTRYIYEIRGPMRIRGAGCGLQIGEKTSSHSLSESPPILVQVCQRKFSQRRDHGMISPRRTGEIGTQYSTSAV